VISFAQHKEREGKGWNYLVGARRRRRDQGKPRYLAAAAAQESSGSESERETGGGRRREADGIAEGEADGEEKNAEASCGPFFSFFENLCFFYFSLPFNFLFLLISYVYSLH
jgi:hypothetical protein